MTNTLGKKLPRKGLLLFLAAILAPTIVFGLATAKTQNILSSGSLDSAAELAKIETVGRDGYGENTGPYDNKPNLNPNENEIESGNVKIVDTTEKYDGGIWLEVDILNRKYVKDRFDNFEENIGIYVTSSQNDGKNWNVNGNWTKFAAENLTISKQPLEFIIESDYMNGHDVKGISVTIENGSYDNIIPLESDNLGTRLYVEADQAN